ncbi:MAG: CHAD domain-containing protein [Prochlorothrix sp.]
MINPTTPPEDTTRPESLSAATPGSHRAAPETEDTAPKTPGEPTATPKTKAAKTKATKTKSAKVKPTKAKVNKAKAAKTTAQAEKSPETEAETAPAATSGTGEAEGAEVATSAAGTPATTEGEAARVTNFKEEGAIAEGATAGLTAEEILPEAVITEEIAPEAVITAEIAAEEGATEEVAAADVVTEGSTTEAVTAAEGASGGIAAEEGAVANLAVPTAETAVNLSETAELEARDAQGDPSELASIEVLPVATAAAPSQPGKGKKKGQKAAAKGAVPSKSPGKIPDKTPGKPPKEKAAKGKKHGLKKSKSAPEPEATSPDLAPATPDLSPLAIAEAAAQAAIDRALAAPPVPTEDLTPLAVPSTLRVVVYGAIQQHFRKTTKARKAVLEDSDPEPLHQMRVGLRRLRSVLYTFDGVMEIPKPGQCRALADLSRCLGSVRDLDVLQVDLSRRTLPHLPTKEQKRLENVLRQIQQQRQQQFRVMEVVLVGDRYKAFKQTYRTWLEEPKYTVLADLPWETESLDLLLSLFCSLFRHPGWCFGTQVCQDQLQVLPWAEHGPALAPLLQNPDRSQQLHHLRKTIKRVRYQSELFLPLYGPSLGELVQDLKRAQEILGQWQDLQVQQATIDRYLKKEIDTHLPDLVQLFATHQAEIWQQWQPLQQQYLDPQYRARVRRILMQVAEPSGFGAGSQ